MPLLDPNLVAVLIVVFVAIFTQSLAGFGSGLVCMALLPALIGLRTAAPLVALIGGTLELALLIRYRNAVSLGSVWRLVAGAVLGIPVGILVLRNVDERIALTLLGLVLIGYSLYGLLHLRMPQLNRANFAYGFGVVAGLLGGAYNVSGPPVVIYGDGCRWSPPEFKGNLQTFFIINDIAVIASHAVSRNFTPLVWQNYIVSLPAIALGLGLGLGASKLLSPSMFRQVLLLVLLVLGVRLIWG